MAQVAKEKNKPIINNKSTCLHFLPLLSFPCHCASSLTFRASVYQSPSGINWPSSLSLSAGYGPIEPTPYCGPGWTTIMTESVLVRCKLFIDSGLGPWDHAQACQMCTHTYTQNYTKVHQVAVPPLYHLMAKLFLFIWSLVVCISTKSYCTLPSHYQTVNVLFNTLSS